MRARRPMSRVAALVAAFTLPVTLVATNLGPAAAAEEGVLVSEPYLPWQEVGRYGEFVPEEHGFLTSSRSTWSPGDQVTLTLTIDVPIETCNGTHPTTGNPTTRSIGAFRAGFSWRDAELVSFSPTEFDNPKLTAGVNGGVYGVTAPNHSNRHVSTSSPDAFIPPGTTVSATYIAPDNEDLPIGTIEAAELANDACTNISAPIAQRTIASAHPAGGGPGGEGPVADFSSERVPGELLTVNFTSESTDAEEPTSSLSHLWDFDDGQTSTLQSPVHEYDAPGTYSVTLTVTDSDGQSDSITRDVVVGGDLVVNSTGDASAVDPGGPQGCDTGAVVDGVPECTLRAALEVTEATGGGEIGFAIPGAGGPTIELGSALPAITQTTTIDAATQSGGQVAVDAGVAENAFEVTGAGSVLRGLVVVDAPVGVRVAADDVLLEDLVIGAMPGGGSPGTVGTGVVVSSGSGARLLDSHVVTDNPGSVAVFVGYQASGLEIRDNRIGVNQDGTAPLGAVQSGIISFGAETVIADNVVRANGAGVVILSADASGSVVQGNRVGLGSSGAFSSQGSGIRVDGAPDVQVLENVIVAGQVADGRAAGISIAGIPQAYTVGANDDEIMLVSYDGSQAVQDGEATGTGIVVKGNTVGSAAAGVAAPGSEAPDGIQVWAEAKNVAITDNTVHGPGATGLVIDDVAQVTATGNQIAAEAAAAGPGVGVRVIGGDGITLGTDVAGNRIGAKTVGVDVTDGALNVAVATNQVTTADDAEESVCVQSTVTARVSGNVLDCARGVTFAPDGDGITGPVIEHNTLTVDDLGIAAEADEVTVVDNTVAEGETAGITISGEKASITDNHVADAGIGIAVDGADATVKDNTVTDSDSDGIAIGAGPAMVDGNEVTGSGGRGIAVSPAASQVTLSGNQVAETTGEPVVVPSGPGAPTIDAVVLDTSGGTARTTLVIGGLPTEGSGKVELFANDSCDDPEAEQVLGIVKDIDGAQDTIAVRLLDRASTDHFTAIYTDTNGSSSTLSACGEVADHPDSDGDGVVDPIDDLSGVGGDPTRVTLVTDDEQLLSLTAVGLDDAPVRFTDAAVTDDPNPAGHGGVEFPFGVVRFTLDGVTTGGRAAVRFIVLDGDPLPATAGYWKYGAVTGTETTGWYEFTSDAATQTGASMLPGTIDVPGYGIRRALAVTLADGGRGDLDRLANGQISDPGAITTVSTGTGKDLPDADFPDDVTGDGLPDGGSPGADLPDTGGPRADLLPMAVFLIILGTALLVRRHRTGPSPM